MRGILALSIVLNLLFVAVEAIVGLTQNSLSLLSDAGHNLSDVLSLLLVLVAIRLAKAHSTKNFTYGYKKSTVLISLLNAILLLVVVGAIIVESIHKFMNPTPVNGAAISWTAGAGIVVNGLTAMLLMRGSRGDLNVRGAFLHMMADTLVSVGVVVSGIVITLTGWTVVDPIVSIAVAMVILASTWSLLSGSLRLSLDGTPEGVDTTEVEELFTATEHVAEVHHLHIWAISTTHNALTAHVVIDDLANMEATKLVLKQRLAEHGIGHSTLEFETATSLCQGDCCD
ncbi:MAG: cation diffusion facilitator family transporter [Bacteroidales bacterium]|nr:cation diffusion facilitator family transporter [Bacteroidales bacterium]